MDATQEKEPTARESLWIRALGFLISKLRTIGGRDLWKSFLTCIAGAAVCLLVRAAGKGFLSEVVRELFLHIAVAFIVAAILTLTIEYNARIRTERETRAFADKVANNVFEGLLTHILPRPVFDEINSVLHSKWIRKDCEYTLTFERPREGMPPDYCVIRRELSFTVENLTTQSIIFPIRSKYSAHPDRTPETLKSQFHSDLKINGKPLEHPIDKYMTADPGSATFEYPLELGPKKEATVELSGEEWSRVGAGSNSYIQGSSVVGIKVSIQNLYPERIDNIQVFMHHPAADDREQRFNRYSLSRAFLPGQGFEIRWSTKTEGNQGSRNYMEGGREP